MLSKDLSFDMSLVLNGLGRAKKAPIDDVFNNNIHSALTLSFQAGDIFGFHKTLERTLAAIPLRGWRALHQWARQSGHPIPDTFAFGAMLEAALIGDTLPAEPADLRRAILELDPKDANSWWRVMFPTGVYIRRSASFLAARLVEQHLGTTWATSLQSFDATQWDIPHYTAMPNTVPSWITRTPEVCERSWSTMIFWANTIRYWQNSFAATKTEYGILFLEKSLFLAKVVL